MIVLHLVSIHQSKTSSWRTYVKCRMARMAMQLRLSWNRVIVFLFLFFFPVGMVAKII